MSAANETLFIVSAVVAIVGAIGTVAAKSPLRAAVALLVHIMALAGLFLTAHAQLLAVIQLLVYAGAIVVLFIFVIMLIGPSATIAGDTRGLLVRTLGLGVMGLLGIALAFALVRVDPALPALPQCAPDDPECLPFGGVEAVGQHIYRNALVPFELAGVALLVAIVAALAVARGRNAREREQLEAQRAAASRDRERAGAPSGDVEPGVAVHQSR